MNFDTELYKISKLKLNRLKGILPELKPKDLIATLPANRHWKGGDSPKVENNIPLADKHPERFFFSQMFTGKHETDIHLRDSEGGYQLFLPNLENNLSANQASITITDTEWVGVASHYKHARTGILIRRAPGK